METSGGKFLLVYNYTGILVTAQKFTGDVYALHRCSENCIAAAATRALAMQCNFMKTIYMNLVYSSLVKLMYSIVNRYDIGKLYGCTLPDRISRQKSVDKCTA